MLRGQIEALENNLLELAMELEIAEDAVKEVKKKISLTKAAHKSLVGLEEKLDESTTVSA